VAEEKVTTFVDDIILILFIWWWRDLAATRWSIGNYSWPITITITHF